jgi:nucleoside-diphosphate-sugar epimerase
MAKRVLITGGAGFVGNELTAQLIAKGYRVTIADDLSNPQSHAPRGARFVRVDVGNKKAARKVFTGQDFCIALACRRGAIGYVARHPTDIVSNNCRIYSSTFESVVEAKIKRLVFISSSMIYEASQKYPTPETMVPTLRTPVSYFGFSKMLGEQFCRAFHQEYGLNYTIIRPSNIYGKNEVAGKKVGDSHVIPDFLKKIETRQLPLQIMGNGRQTRCFVHVSDIAAGIIRAMESPKGANNDFNMGGSTEVDILGLAKMLWRFYGMKQPLKPKFVGAFPQDVPRQFMSTKKARTVLGWKPKKSFEEGLREIVAWYKQRSGN